MSKATALKKLSAVPAMAVLFLFTPAMAADPGSGRYAYDCSKPQTILDIALGPYNETVKSLVATVTYGGKTYRNVPRAVSWYGRNSPPNFETAILLNGVNGFKLPNQQGTGFVNFVEIWRDRNGYYVMDEQNQSQRRRSCGN